MWQRANLKLQEERQWDEGSQRYSTCWSPSIGYGGTRQIALVLPYVKNVICLSYGTKLCQTLPHLSKSVNAVLLGHLCLISVLKYKNTSSRDFQGATRWCLTETTHFNETKCYRVRLLTAMSS